MPWALNFFLLPPDLPESIRQCPFTSLFIIHTEGKKTSSLDGLENMPAFAKEMGNTLVAL